MDLEKVFKLLFLAECGYHPAHCYGDTHLSY